MSSHRAKFFCPRVISAFCEESLIWGSKKTWEMAVLSFGLLSLVLILGSKVNFISIFIPVDWKGYAICLLFPIENWPILTFYSADMIFWTINRDFASTGVKWSTQDIFSYEWMMSDEDDLKTSTTSQFSVSHFVLLIQKTLYYITL